MLKSTRESIYKKCIYSSKFHDYLYVVDCVLSQEAYKIEINITYVFNWNVFVATIKLQLTKTFIVGDKCLTIYISLILSHFHLMKLYAVGCATKPLGLG